MEINFGSSWDLWNSVITVSISTWVYCSGFMVWLYKTTNNLKSPTLMNGIVKRSHSKPLLHPNTSKKFEHCRIFPDSCPYNLLFKSQKKWTLGPRLSLASLCMLLVFCWATAYSVLTLGLLALYPQIIFSNNGYKEEQLFCLALTMLLHFLSFN